MDWLIGAIVGGIVGAGVAFALSAVAMEQESMERFNDGYHKGLDDGKRMKGEK